MANTLMIDTNIILDVFQKRESFFEDAKTVLIACADRRINGVIAANSVCDIFYIYHNYCHDKEKAYDVIGKIIKILRAAPLMGIDILKAYDARAKDFEDRVVGEVAMASKCEGIITRDKKGFEGLDIPLYTPKEAIEKFL